MTEYYYIDTEDIITDFLRNKLIDPRARAEASESQSFSPSNSDKIITLASPTLGSVSCITEVTIDGINSGKWKDYYWDYQNSTLTFYNTFNGTEEVIITYKYGTSNWIFSDKVDEQLKATSFPRISIFMVSNPAVRQGQYEAPMESNPSIQIDIWVKDKYIYNVNDRKYSNNYLTRYIGNQITRAFEDNENELFPLLYNYRGLSGVRTAPYSPQYQAFHSIVEANFKSLRTGRIEVN